MKHDTVSGSTAPDATQNSLDLRLTFRCTQADMNQHKPQLAKLQRKQRRLPGSQTPRGTIARYPMPSPAATCAPGGALRTVRILRNVIK